MAASSPHRDTSDAEPTRATGDLARLLDAERRLDASLAETRRVADERLSSGRARARAIRADAAERLERELVALREELREEHRDKVDAIETSAERRARRYRDVPEDVVDELAREVTRRLVEDAR